MGKLSDFFAKIKGLFNRNKALPEGKEENYIMPNISERKEEAKMTEHENFVNTLQKQAKSFDLSQMPVEDAISKALEEKGLNSNIANNPEFKKQVNKIFEDIFQHQSTPTTEMAETANSRMQISRMPKSSRMPTSSRTPTSSSQEITVSRMPKASRKVRQDKAESATIETTVTDRIIVRPVNSATTTSAAMHQRTYVLAATEEEEALHRRSRVLPSNRRSRTPRVPVIANMLQW